MNTRNHPGAKPKHIAAASMTAAAALCVAVFFLSSCSNDPIFAAIEEEVELKDPSVRGTITSLVDVGGDLYVSNGKIYRKTAGNGEWNTIAMPAYRCAELATDGTDGSEYLYGLFQDDNYGTTGIYRLDGGQWTAVTESSNITKIESGNGGIFAFAVDGQVDSAYTYTAYMITGTAAPVITTVTDISAPIGSALGYFATAAGLYTPSGLVTGAPASGIAGITTDGADIYLATSGDIHKFAVSGATWTSTPHNVGSPTGMTFLDTDSVDLLLISGASGYGEVTVTAGVLGAAQNPGDSSTSSITVTEQSQYDNSLGQWNLTSIFAVSDGTGSDYDVYAGVMDTRYDGLWGYHSTDASPEWNRE